MSWRKVWTTPVLAAEWNQDYEEHAASWWELFVDLLLVVTFSSIAESFEEDLSGRGLLAFLVTFTIFFQGWQAYTAFSSRFIDNSLLHSVQLFLFILATASMVTNSSGFQYAPHFAMSAIWQRLSVALMYVSVYAQVPRARIWVCWVLGLTCTSTGILYFATISTAPSNSEVFLTIAALWEGFLSLPTLWCIRQCVNFQLIPINIDHNAERMSCFVMVVLGESIVSALFDYHRRGLDPAETPKYLEAMALSLCLTFSFGLIYYAVQPPREVHALRRSGICGIGFIIGHLVLSMSLLAVGVGVKLAMHPILEGIEADRAAAGAAPAKEAEMSAAAAWLLFGAGTAALISILLIRLLHYGGREPRLTDSALVWRLKWLWWLSLAAVAVLPLAVGAALIPAEGGLASGRALWALVAVVGAFAISETCVAHLLLFLVPEMALNIPYDAPQPAAAREEEEAAKEPLLQGAEGGGSGDPRL